MKDIVNKIIEENKSLFDEVIIFEKINVGFTNTIYNVNGKYIIKICSNIENEEKFLNEIEFYKKNKDNKFIPKLYKYDISKKTIPNYYLVIENVKGVSLYNVWHILNETERENVIKKLCETLKSVHSIKGNNYDWVNYIKDEFNSVFDRAKELELFKKEELKRIDKVYNKFDKYLVSNEFVLVHNDIHFDNIIYNNGEIKLIDFERSIYAPIDFELDILYRMIRKPWKFANEEIEEFTNLDDYKNIMKYIEKYYKELVSVDYLKERLAIYDMLYYMKQYVSNPDIEEIKQDVINATKIILI